MKIVVEGVESDWQARLLQLLGCDLLQGFELGVPMTLDALQQFRRDLKAADLANIAGPALISAVAKAG